MTSPLDSPVVQVVAEALARADWENYGQRNSFGQRNTDWGFLPEPDREYMVRAQLRAARVAVNAIQEAA